MLNEPLVKMFFYFFVNLTISLIFWHANKWLKLVPSDDTETLNFAATAPFNLQGWALEYSRTEKPQFLGVREDT